VLATRAALRSSLRDLSPGELVLVAVSGGADSLALAAATAHVVKRLRLRAGAVTVDHQLQAESAARADDVARTCRDVGLDPIVVRRVDVGRQGGPEAAARTARYAAFDAVAAETGAAVVLLGHTLDDQAETVLLRLARGSGARSLAAMPRAHDRYRRPFLDLRRSDTAAACRVLGLPVWDDPHNGDPRFTRSRVRHDLLPVVEQVLGTGAVQGLARSADLARADADALEEWADKSLADLAGSDGLDVVALAALPAAVRSRVLRRAAVVAGAPPGRLAAAHIAALDALVTDWHGQGSVDLPGGLVGQRRCDRLQLR
jgi:tRNA(Ile)-lysidine synthase